MRDAHKGQYKPIKFRWESCEFTIRPMIEEGRQQESASRFQEEDQRSMVARSHLRDTGPPLPSTPTDFICSVFTISRRQYENGRLVRVKGKLRLEKS